MSSPFLSVLLLLFVLAPSAYSQMHIFQGEASSGSTTTIRIRFTREFKIQAVAGSITLGWIRWDGGSWASLSTFDTGAPVLWRSATVTSNAVPSGPGTSGQEVYMAGSSHYVEFDWNQNGIPDAGVNVEICNTNWKLWHPGATGSAYATIMTPVPPVIINISSGAEKYVTVDDPTPILGDNDNDGIADGSDPDDDNDGIPDGLDLFPFNPAESGDWDSDGTGDTADQDDDNDGAPDNADAFPGNAGEQADSDGDGWGNNSDPAPNDPASPGGKGGVNGDGTTGTTLPGGNSGSGGTGTPNTPAPGSGDRAGDDPRLNETSEGWVDKGDTPAESKGEALANKVDGVRGLFGSKFSGFTPFAVSSIPTQTTIPVVANLGPLGSINEEIDLTSTPFPQIRAAFLVCLIAATAFAFLKRLTI